jgi:hypothetical protein
MPLDAFEARLRAGALALLRANHQAVSLYPEEMETELAPLSTAALAAQAMRNNNGRLTAKVRQDLEKICFDFENCEHEGDEAAPDGFMGIQVLPNGMPFCGLFAGGDWESPVHFILYCDAKGLRAYIPEAGNTFNPESRTAYGSEDERDCEEFEGEPPPMDVPAMLADIAARIQVAP